MACNCQKNIEKFKIDTNNTSKSVFTHTISNIIILLLCLIICVIIFPLAIIYILFAGIFSFKTSISIKNILNFTKKFG